MLIKCLKIKVWQLDCDVFLTNPGTLRSMAFKTDMVVVAPVLKSLGRYSNFWGGMTNEVNITFFFVTFVK